MVGYRVLSSQLYQQAKGRDAGAREYGQSVLLACQGRQLRVNMVFGRKRLRFR